jgi:hypothetical protein
MREICRLFPIQPNREYHELQPQENGAAGGERQHAGTHESSGIEFPN